MSASEPVNLVMVYAKNALDVEDFEKIARRIKKLPIISRYTFTWMSSLARNIYQNWSNARPLFFRPCN